MSSVSDKRNFLIDSFIVLSLFICFTLQRAKLYNFEQIRCIHVVKTYANDFYTHSSGSPNCDDR